MNIDYNLKKEVVLRVMKEDQIFLSNTEVLTKFVDRCVEQIFDELLMRGDIVMQKTPVSFPTDVEVQKKIEEIAYESIGLNAIDKFWGKLKNRLKTGKWEA